MLPGWLNVVVSWPCRGGRATLAQINNPSDPNAKSDERRGCFMEFVLPVELCQEWISTRSSKSAQHTPFGCPSRRWRTGQLTRPVESVIDPDQLLIRLHKFSQVSSAICYLSGW